jgi:hypothetical protein
MISKIVEIASSTSATTMMMVLVLAYGVLVAVTAVSLWRRGHRFSAVALSVVGLLGAPLIISR